jgi:poly-gamma-glutamate capsule biosynthesis protein CapA/YwtB (metallophosphatase superfamily)
MNGQDSPETGIPAARRKAPWRALRSRKGKPTLVFTAVGDCIITRRVSKLADRDFLELVDLVQGVDSAFANLELTTPRQPLVPFSEFGGGHSAAEPFVLDELKGMGLDLFGLAHNHAVDYTFAGLVDTLDELRARDMAAAGAGRNLGEARSPAYLDTPAGRVALVACASTFMASAQAAEARTDVDGRPGISPLRHDTAFVVTAEQLESLRAIDEALGTAAVVRRHKAFGVMPERDPEAYMFLDRAFKVGEAPAVSTRCSPKDLDGIGRWIADARRQASLVVVGMHCHEGERTDSNSPTPAEFVVEATHRFIDDGADVFVGHGPHMLRGIEIYKGKPIFYSLGNFFFMLETIGPWPSEMYEQQELGPNATPADVMDQWSGTEEGGAKGFHKDARFWQSVLPVCRYDGHALRSIDLYPIELGLARPRPQRGVPRLAALEEGREILLNLAALSTPFGTAIDVTTEGDRAVGHVRLAGPEASA